MKLKGVLFFVAFISLPVMILSCGPRGYSCNCTTSSKGGQHYSVGNSSNMSFSNVSSKCSALKTQYGWDTCIAVQEAQ